MTIIFALERKIRNMSQTIGGWFVDPGTAMLFLATLPTANDRYITQATRQSCQLKIERCMRSKLLNVRSENPRLPRSSEYMFKGLSTARVTQPPRRVQFW